MRSLAAVAFAKWHFRPQANGKLRSVSGLMPFFHAIRSFWLASGKTPRETSNGMLELKRRLRRRKERGWYEELMLRSADPDPAPADEQVTRVRAYYVEEAERLRAKGGAGKTVLFHLLQERNALETFARTGMRLRSGVSARLDRIVYERPTDSV